VFVDGCIIRQRRVHLPEYGQSFMMMLTNCEGMSAVKYGLVSGGIGGKPEASTGMFLDPMLLFSAVTVGENRREGSLVRASGFPHRSRYLRR
jgi:hypothetical protein